eukprot:TRINITY_DN92035_c0_g1_i1.p1 TRINITY_DN92035_c0_g1~~TRINITY_DN92035_c0_g1_i1.p1  ORF type:complete len:297 (+),score=91.53 TRINITY_DN92035_c0_g1_i1:89-979(+)
MEDELQEVRDNFYVGNFAKTLQMAEGVMPSSDLTQFENDAMTARCYFALGKFDQLKALQNSQNPGQKGTALFAVITKAPKEEVRNSAKEHLLKLAKETQDMTATMLAAIVTAADGSYTDAVQMCKAHPTLEMQALCIYFALLCNQAQMAEKMLLDMKGTNDDSVAYRMASAAVKLATGDPEEAYLTYCDLSAQFPPVDGEDSGCGSTLMETGKAVANMQRGMHAEAMEDLQRAVQQAPNDPDLLVNLCCCCAHLNKMEEFQTHYAKLERVKPSHQYVMKTQAISQAFTRFKASVTA